MNAEKAILSTAEKSITGISLLTSQDSGRVRIESTHVDQDTVRYTVTGRLELGRTAIAEILATPVGYKGSDWRLVRDGLRDVSYPSTLVSKSSRNAQKRSQLRELRPAARELADIMTNNQSYRSQSTNAPVFNSYESYDYVNDILFKETSPSRLVSQLKSIGLDTATSRQLTDFVFRSRQSQDVVHELQQLTGLTDEEITQADNHAIFERVDKRIWAELAHRLQDKMFVGFLQDAMYEDGTLQFGGDDNSAFLLENDVPKNILQSTLGTSVNVGRQVGVVDRKNPQERREITFLQRAASISARPQITWERSGTERRFVFPKNTYDTTKGEAVSRPNSLLGAALAANFGRAAYNIAYYSALTNRLFGRPNKGFGTYYNHFARGAGMLPLVIHHHEAKLLGDKYFTAIEDAIE